MRGPDGGAGEPNEGMVTPERKIARVADKTGLNEFVAAYNAKEEHKKIDAKLKACIGQLLGFDKVGDDRHTRRTAEGFFNAANATWFCKGDIDAPIPVFGSAPEKYRQLNQLATVSHAFATFKRLVATPGKVSEDGWQPSRRGAAKSALAKI